MVNTKKILYYTSNYLRSIADSVYLSKEQKKEVSFLNIGKNKIKNPKYAAVFYVTDSIPYFLHDELDNCSFLLNHSMYWESIEIIRVLNDLGYVVDYYDCREQHIINDAGKYNLIIDERNYLNEFNFNLKATKIFYGTGIQWLFHNTAEYKRLLDFRLRTGISLPTERQVQPTKSEELAQYSTYFGGEFQRNLLSYPNRGVQLSLSSSFLPEKKEKNIKTSRQNILWIGSRGYIHKGLDIVLEAFKLQKDFNLHICTNLHQEPLFFDWFNKNFSRCPNIFYHGWMNVNDTIFHQLAENCIATVYCSAAEGGAGSIIQAMQFGCIPLVNETTALSAQEIGFFLKGDTFGELVSEINKTLSYISGMSDSELIEKSGLVREYANKNHSRSAYTTSLKNLFKKLVIE